MIRGKRENMREDEERESLFDKIDITKYSVKSLVAIPLIILLFAFAMMAYTQLSVGSPVLLGMDFQGGTMVRVGTDETREELTAKFADYPLALVGGTGVGNEKRIEFGPMSKSQRDELIDLLNADYGVGSYQMANISPVFGKQYLTQGLYALMFAFFLMAIVVFAVFRTVIGYSVDSNILLTTNMLRKKGDLNDKLRNTMKTGVMMTSTTLTAIFAMFIVSYFIDITILKAISIVLIFGLVMDLMNTWLLNAGILRWYIEKQEKKKFVRRGTKRDVAKGKATKKVKA